MNLSDFISVKTQETSICLIFTDQLDKCYISLRNGCRDDRLSLAARYRLLEVIELRAMHWQPNENLINYYKQKLAQIEVRVSKQSGGRCEQRMMLFGYCVHAMGVKVVAVC